MHRSLLAAPRRHRGYVTGRSRPSRRARLWGTTDARRASRLRERRHQDLARTTVLPGLGARRPSPGVRTRMRASTATQRSGSASTGFRSSSATAGRSSPSRASRRTRSTSAGDVGRGRAAEAGDEPARLAAVDELLGVDVGERRDPERRLADQLGEDAAGPERDERAEDRVLHDARREARRRPSSIGWTITGQPDARRRRPRPPPRPRGRARSRPSPSCAPRASAVLTTAGKPSSRAAATASSTDAATRSGTSGTP